MQIDDLESFDLGALLLGILNFFGDKFDPRVIGISVLRKCYFSRSVHPSTGPGLSFHNSPQFPSLSRTRTQSQARTHFQSQQSYVQVGGQMMSYSRSNDTNISFVKSNNYNYNYNDGNKYNYNSNNIDVYNNNDGNSNNNNNNNNNNDDDTSNNNDNNNNNNIHGNYIPITSIQKFPSSNIFPCPTLPPSSFVSPLRQQLVLIPKAADRRHSFQASDRASLNSVADTGRKFSTSSSTSTSNRFFSNNIHPSLETNKNNSFINRTGSLSYVPYKFDPLFVEDPLNLGNNVGRNCFRVLQVQKSWSDIYLKIKLKLISSSKDGVYHPVLDILVGEIND